MIALVLHTVKLDETDHYAFILVLKLVIDKYFEDIHNNDKTRKQN